MPNVTTGGMPMTSTVRRRMLQAGILVLLGCSDSDSSGPGTVVTVTVTLAASQLTVGQTTTAAALVLAANGSPVGSAVAWQSSNAQVATVSGNGATAIVTAVAAGTTMISATSGGKAGQAQLTVVSPASCSELSVDANTVALYHFNEGSGQAVANSVTGGPNGTLGPDLTTNQDPAWLATGKFGPALSFTRGATDAASDYVLVNQGNTFPTNQASVELYVRPRAPYGHSNLFVAGFINFTFNINNNGTIEFGIGNGTDWSFANTTGHTLNDGNWHQVAGTYDGSMMRVYVDGQQKIAVAATTQLATPTNYYIGGRPSNTFLNGDIDELRVSRIARTAAEIQANYCP